MASWKKETSFGEKERKIKEKKIKKREQERQEKIKKTEIKRERGRGDGESIKEKKIEQNKSPLRNYKKPFMVNSINYIA